ncbi:MAG: ATP-binding protein [Treponema sp.]|jgi:AAA15 family ATPase/GTPase|nr:ATP-binding protein [Treponema sp.]
MILEIRLENFYSIKDEVFLDFRAEKINTETAKVLSENTIDYNGQKILKSIGLFGANASGKSNIIKSINRCCQIVLNSHTNNEGDIFNFSTFKFGNYSNLPSSFSINFTIDNTEYEYSFSLTRTEIIKESLYYYPNGRRAKIFTRDETKGNNKQKIYNFSNGHIPRPFDVAINTSKKTLYLSRASQMDRELCKKLYRFFKHDFLIGFAPLDYIQSGLRDVKKVFSENKNIILHALSICDSDILDVNIVNEKQKFFLPDASSSAYYEQNIDSHRFETFHKAAPEISFDLLSEESAGTTQLFNMLFVLLDAVKNGKTFILDEFDLSLHAKLAEFVIDLFHASSTAQFIFTSHNTSLINVKRFRRDQILFVNKKDDSSTELYSLFDHKDFRENMDAEKGYLQGRFDAIPIIDNSATNIRKLLGEQN